MIIVSDSSPLVALSIVGMLHLIERLYGELRIPEAVLEEVTVSGKPSSRELEAFLENKTQAVRNRIAADMLGSAIGKGEAEAIILALETNASAVMIDDRKARRYARMRELPVTGTVGLLIQAKSRGLVENIYPLIYKMERSGIRLSPRIVEIALREAGEKPPHP
ncbi:MAG: DUF3368 domain-containing protein [Spirochaetaceae bacterium]|nr:MAG: DUF3368 domain-containing protein [Spirochaetaceae bacterium]